ncbi:ectoine synthase [Actinocrispum wychmicini]|uniref:L-ectoine synthase n=1 Tax=Actinocrispum wychmicini TaxID=1213861 RepID=A0A4R2JKQ4_9PSEU|nr:ectoine synthase [Actinocrispum wychmicini]TCO60581.1 L-ectoine synthase [Actinocrispum wychmicini]
MIVRRLSDVPTVDWGNGLSRRFLVQSDGMGYTVTDTTVRAGTKSRLEYRRHLEACYCIEGSGEVVDMNGQSHPLEPGVLYALDEHDAHFLIAAPHEDMRLVCVFTPALQGNETHKLDSAEFSHY